MIGQKKYLNNTLLVTPGIHLEENKDNLGQTYNIPQKAKKKGTDVFIIGRGIYNATHPLDELLKYKECLLGK